MLRRNDGVLRAVVLELLRSVHVVLLGAYTSLHPVHVYTPYTSYYTPYTSYYTPSTSYYAPTYSTYYAGGWYPGYWMNRIRTRLWGSPTTYVAAYPASYTTAYAPSTCSSCQAGYVTSYAPACPTCSSCSACASPCSTCSACAPCSSCSTCTASYCACLRNVCVAVQQL